MGALHDDLDVLVIGSGIAGLTTAIALSGRRDVAVVSKQAGGGSTELAQGGVAAALGPDDSPDAHAWDTLAAAAGLGDEAVALAVTGEAPGAVAFLAGLGVRFDTGAPGREGGHSAARVVHARGDATGAEISHALMGAARRVGVPIVAGMSLVDLLVVEGRVAGALLWDQAAGALCAVHAPTVVLATGGYGQLWASTTSPSECGGDGLAAALRAGAQAADLEFVQFHPTGMVLGTDPRPLATEALRGAGARLRDAAGEHLHPSSGQSRGDLAPRDVVSASMGRRMARLGAEHCYLDATVLGPELLARQFPTFVAACRAAGIEPAHDWVPVSPTAHYTMGGVLTDDAGRTTLDGLMAVGEVASSGLHGANRLASNSLLEGVVVGRRAAAAVLGSEGPVVGREPVEVRGALEEPRGRVRARELLDRAQLRAAMQGSAGVFRDASGLESLGALLAGAFQTSGLEVPGPASSGPASFGPASFGPASFGPASSGPASFGPASFGLASMGLVARAVVAAALRREESRGAHRRADFEDPVPRWRVRQVVQVMPGGELGVGELAVKELAVDGLGLGERGGQLDDLASSTSGFARSATAAAAR